MPCNSDHLAPSSLEIEVSRLYILLDELAGKGEPNPRSDRWHGCDKRAYNVGREKLRELADELTARLCEKVKKVDMKKCSLELQVWARDHARADAKKRASREKARKKQDIKVAALKKLTKAERKALGL